MMEFYSHIKPHRIILKDHLLHVGNRSKKLIESKEINNEIDKAKICDISYLIGISHDFGKYTTFFQEKLLYQKNISLTRHGLISALFTFEVLSEYIETKKLNDVEPYKFLPLIGYFVVKHHHGDLNDIENDVNEEILFEQFKNIPTQLEILIVTRTK